MLNKKSVDDINVKGQKVLVRCDFNVPLQDGKITDENRLVAALPTIKKLIADGGKVILCSHLGKPKGEPKPELSLAPVAVRLSELLGQEVKFAADPEVVGPNAKAAVAEMKDGDVVLLENTRYRAEETKNEDKFSEDLASLCDVFVNDAFGTAHRAHCSNVGVTKYVKTAVVEGNVTVEQINEAMKAASNESFGYNTDEIVSSDIVGMRYGSLFDATQTMVMPLDNGTTQVQVVSWYDNENSYTSQMVRTIKYFSELA